VDPAVELMDYLAQVNMLMDPTVTSECRNVPSSEGPPTRRALHIDQSQHRLRPEQLERAFEKRREWPMYSLFFGSQID
jgi:hypothetical protein